MLSQEDRIAFTKKIVEGPALIASVTQSKASISVELTKARALDNAHKNLVDGKTAVINAYQAELIKLDGITRSNLTEQNIQDAANLVLGNSLYPNNINSPPPSLAPNLWTQTKPYAKNLAIGQFYTEAYGASVPKESDSVSPVSAAIASIEALYTAIQRTTGQHCLPGNINGGVCSLPSYTTQSTCIAATPTPGVWTPASIHDQIVTYPEVVTALADLVTKLNTYKSYLQAEVATVYLADKDPTRKTQNQAAADYINNTTIPAINAWLALADFDTNTFYPMTMILENTCLSWNAYDYTTLGPTKLQPSQINILKSAISARAAFVGTRQTQLISYLGSITQDPSTGETTGSGLYFERWSFIQLRLNMLGGSLFALKGYERAGKAQDEQISNIKLANASYALFLTCSQFQSPATGTKYVSVKDASKFAVGDNVYIVSNSQPEIGITIAAIVGNRIEFGQIVPANYREGEFARVYKDLS